MGGLCCTGCVDACSENAACGNFVKHEVMLHQMKFCSCDGFVEVVDVAYSSEIRMAAGHHRVLWTWDLCVVNFSI